MQADATRLETRDKFVSEMQASGRGCDRSLFVCEQRLVGAAVVVVRRAARRDIWGQRHVAPLCDRLVEHRPVEREREGDLATVAFRLDARIKLAEKAHLALVAEADSIADREPPRGLYESSPARAVQSLHQIGLDRCFRPPSDAPAMKARR